MATFLDLQEEVMYHLRQREDLRSFVKEKINLALLDVMLLVEPPEFQASQNITTVAGTTAYDLTSPNDVLAVIGVSHTGLNFKGNNRRLRHGDYRDFDSMDTDTTTIRGEPRQWFRYANEIILYDEVPDDNDGNEYTVKLRTLDRPAEMLLDAAVFPLELEWEEATVLRAAHKIHVMLGHRDRAQEVDQFFKESIDFVLKAPSVLEKRYDKDAGMHQATHRHSNNGGRDRARK